MMRAAGDDHETLLTHLAALTLDFEIQRAGQTEHQLRVVVAVDDQIVGVLAQSQDRAHGRGLRSERQSTPGQRACALSHD